MMRLVFILQMLLLLSITAFAGTPTAGDVTLRLKDTQQRAIINASVTFEYTYTDPLFGELRKTDVIYSNQFGVAQKTLAADFNTPYRITVAYHGASQVIDSTWAGGLDRFVNLQLADFSIRTVDSESSPIGNVPLRIKAGTLEFSSSTNATGYAVFQQYNSQINYLVYARYGGTEHSTQLIPDNRPHTIQIPTYAVQVRTINDDGNAVISDMNLTFMGVVPIMRRTAGIVGLFTQVPEGNATLSLAYGGRLITDIFYVNSSSTRTYVFDMNPPNFSAPAISPEQPVPENEVAVYMNITDPGVNASGLPPLINLIPPAELYYSLDGAEWKSVHMFPEANNITYKGRIPGQPANSVVRYYAVAWDKANNTGRSQQYAFNNFVNGTTDGRPPPINFGAILAQLWWVILIPVVLIAAYYIKKKYF